MTPREKPSHTAGTGKRRLAAALTTVASLTLLGSAPAAASTATGPGATGARRRGPPPRRTRTASPARRACTSTATATSCSSSSAARVSPSTSATCDAATGPAPRPTTPTSTPTRSTGAAATGSRCGTCRPAPGGTCPPGRRRGPMPSRCAREPGGASTRGRTVKLSRKVTVNASAPLTAVVLLLLGGAVPTLAGQAAAETGSAATSCVDNGDPRVYGQDAFTRQSADFGWTSTYIGLRSAYDASCNTWGRRSVRASAPAPRCGSTAPATRGAPGSSWAGTA